MCLYVNEFIEKDKSGAYRGVTNGTLTDQKGPGDWESRRDVENVERDTGRFKGLFSLLFRIVCGLPHGFRGGFPLSCMEAGIGLIGKSTAAQ